MVAVYCDRECQKKGWKTHRNNCFEDTALARKQMKESLKNEGATLESRFMAAVCFGQLAAARQYYSLGADIKGTGKSLAAISSAVAGRHLEILKFVVEEVGIHVDSLVVPPSIASIRRPPKQPLYQACISGHVPITEYLIDHGPDASHIKQELKVVKADTTILHYLAQAK